MNTALHSTVAMKKHIHHMIHLIIIQNILVYLRCNAHANLVYLRCNAHANQQKHLQLQVYDISVTAIWWTNYYQTFICSCGWHEPNGAMFIISTVKSAGDGSTVSADKQLHSCTAVSIAISFCIPGSGSGPAFSTYTWTTLDYQHWKWQHGLQLHVTMILQLLLLHTMSHKPCNNCTIQNFCDKTLEFISATSDATYSC